jgi:gamma-glutamyltranspeptidase/glutathione hydrolase
MPKVTIAASSNIAAVAGATIANQGGNAVDAALAATIVSMCTDLGVMAPGASGFITIWPPQSDPVVIDAYAEMPGRGLPPTRLGKAVQEVCFDYGGWMKTLIGYGSVATPGILAGLVKASKQYGTMPWAEVVAPALQWTQRGFPLSGGAAEYLQYTHKAIFSWHPDSDRAVHRNDGSLFQAGEIVKVPHLADSLAQIAREGAETFYRGELGEQMAAEIQAHQGLLNVRDLAAYRAITRSPIRIHFGDWEVATNPSPAVGGACLGAMLLLLDHDPPPQWDPTTVAQLALIQEAVLNYRRYHLNQTYHRSLDAKVTQLLELANLGDLHLGLKSPSTIHTSAVDSNGLACSISASAGYGSGVMITGTGLWLNNSLGEIELHPHSLQHLSPGTRLTSNMAPTIARSKDGAILAIGSPGASRITTAIAQVLANLVHLGMPITEAVEYPRLHFELESEKPTIAFEAGLPVELVAGFAIRQFPQPSMYFGGVQAVLWEPAKGLSGAADTRRGGGVAHGEKV